MYYHTAILLLFRPFLKARIHHSSVVPRDVCRASAEKVSDLWFHHQSLYGLTGIYMFQVHCLLSATTVHIINLPSISATRYFTAACNSFQDLVGRNDWARSSLTIVRHLVEKWNMIIPQEAEEALYRSQHFREERGSDAATSTSLDLHLDSSPPEVMQATDPASAYPSNSRFAPSSQMETQQRQQGTGQMQQSPALGTIPPPIQTQNNHDNLDPALYSPGSSSQSTSASKRTSNHLASQLNAHKNQKRQRMIAPSMQSPDSSALGATHPPLSAPASAASDPTSPTMADYQDPEQHHHDAMQMQNPESYLYVPLMNQAAPLLMPVHQIGANLSMPPSSAAGQTRTTAAQQQQQQQQHQTRAHGFPAEMQQHAPVANMTHAAHAAHAAAAAGISSDEVKNAGMPTTGIDTSSATGAMRMQQGQRGAANPHLKMEPMDEGLGVSGAETVGQHGGGHQGHVQGYHQQNQGQAHGQGQGMGPLQTGVEGLTFGDDWRDPFMGFLEVD